MAEDLRELNVSIDSSSDDDDDDATNTPVTPHHGGVPVTHMTSTPYVDHNGRRNKNNLSLVDEEEEIGERGDMEERFLNAGEEGN